MEKIINGGMLKGKKTYITTTIGILTAIGAYFVGEMNLVNLLQTVFPLAGILFMRKGMKN
ncbi:MAG: hypothetical protein ACTSXL_03895 [Alphaproteobacteria bacterium]